MTYTVIATAETKMLAAEARVRDIEARIHAVEARVRAAEVRIHNATQTIEMLNLSLKKTRDAYMLKHANDVELIDKLNKMSSEELDDYFCSLPESELD